MIIKENISGILDLEFAKSQTKSNAIISEYNSKAAYYKIRSQEFNDFMNKLEIMRMRLKNLLF
ncbi:MAG: hypothetical protein IJS99_04640 [Synergistaceae bacterium]|nr:hypothetical protein [Synergistaceae bacterium]